MTRGDLLAAGQRDLDPRLHVDQACLLAGRNLTRTEWENYLGALDEWRATCPEFR